MNNVELELNLIERQQHFLQCIIIVLILLRIFF